MSLTCLRSLPPPPARLLELGAAAWAPPERLAPSEWAARHRVLPTGPWRNDVFPYLTAIMDLAAEAVRLGKVGVVLMKSGQGGGTEAVLNVAGWAKVNLPGPLAYVCAKEDQAIEMARTRIDPMIRTCAPLNARALYGRMHGELVNRKRFIDGPWMIVGGRAVSNLEAFPQRVLIFDEIDSIQDEYVGKGDPLENALIRTASYTVPTLALVLAHPTTAERGAGKLYYEESDQRRAFAPCAHCGTPFWLQRDHVRVLPQGDETMEMAARRPDRYVYVTPCCGVELRDGDRWWMADRTEQRTTLGLDLAASKRWIGCHFSWFYMRKPLEELVYSWIKSEGKSAERRVVVNKQDGDVWREVARESDPAAWRACIVIPRSQKDPRDYALGAVPPSVQFLTAGQDSRQKELHYAVWGWGLERDTAGVEHFLGWLIDCGVIDRHDPKLVLEPSDFALFDQRIYERGFVRTDANEALYVQSCLHDSGWSPIAVYSYCTLRPDRAIPAKGAAEDSASVAPPIRWGSAPRWKVGGEEVSDARLQYALLNTYLLKEELHGMVSARRVVLPRDVPERFIAESSAERKIKDDRDRWVWRAKGPNHYADCDVYALAAALQLRPYLQKTRAEEIESRPSRPVEPERRDGGWWTGQSREGRW